MADQRCSIVLRVDQKSYSMMEQGDYPCTQPKGHKGPHTSVVKWTKPIGHKK